MEKLLKKLGITEKDFGQILIQLHRKQRELIGKQNGLSTAQRKQVDELLEEIEKAITTLSYIVKGSSRGESEEKQGEPAAVSKDSGVVLTHCLAKNGDAQAQFELGGLYDQGIRVPQDDKLAVKWYREAANQSHPGAQLSLGMMYINGRGVERSQDEALLWQQKALEQYEMAAKRGNAQSQFALAGSMKTPGVCSGTTARRCIGTRKPPRAATPAAR